MIVSLARALIATLAIAVVLAVIPARAAALRFAVDPGQCEVISVVAQPLTKFRGNAIGSFQVRSGEISGDPANPSVGAIVKLVFDASSYSSGNSRRDHAVADEVLDSADYPDIKFESTGVQDLAMDTPGAGSALISGNLTLRGETRQVGALVSVVMIGTDRIEARGELTFRYPKFGLPVPPGLFGLVHASDEVTIKFRIVAIRAAS
ncbi:MAG TPA: YceI family protein [Candidatus Binataceae bacterium]|nr:YceI family protein [Candidatus Binataceae bacterium]